MEPVELRTSWKRPRARHRGNRLGSSMCQRCGACGHMGTVIDAEGTVIREGQEELNLSVEPQRLI
jgi:hypothetical protein